MFRLVGHPFTQLLTINAFVCKDDHAKQVPLAGVRYYVRQREGLWDEFNSGRHCTIQAKNASSIRGHDIYSSRRKLGNTIFSIVVGGDEISASLLLLRNNFKFVSN